MIATGVFIKNGSQGPVKCGEWLTVCAVLELPGASGQAQPAQELPSAPGLLSYSHT